MTLLDDFNRHVAGIFNEFMVKKEKFTNELFEQYGKGEIDAEAGTIETAE